MVVSHKLIGVIRISVDLTKVTKAIGFDRYHLLTIYELADSFPGSLVLSKIHLQMGYL